MLRHRGKSPRQAAFFSAVRSSGSTRRTLRACFCCTVCCAQRPRASSRAFGSARSSPAPSSAVAMRIIGSCIHRRSSPSSTPGSCCSLLGGTMRLHSSAARTAEACSCTTCSRSAARLASRARPATCSANNGKASFTVVKSQVGADRSPRSHDEC